ncbi:MAG: RNA polymerase sigma factor [Candidatus Dojkabacteria bacterium]
MYTTDLQKEKQLLSRAQENSKDFGELYEYFVSHVYRYAFSLTGNQGESEDITSNTFIKFYSVYSRFEWKGISLRHWLFRTARNLAYRRKPIIIPLQEQSVHIADETEISFVDEIINKEFVQQVKEVILTLKPEDQEVINLRIWEGMEFHDIADILSEKPATVRQRFYRAIEKIRKILKTQGKLTIISYPLIFTSIVHAAKTQEYTLPEQLIHFSNKTAMNNSLLHIKNYLTSNFGIVIITGMVVLTGIGIGTWTHKIHNSETRTEETKTSDVNRDLVSQATTTYTTNEGTEYEVYKDEGRGFQFGLPVGETAGLIERNAHESKIFDISYTPFPEQNSDNTKDTVIQTRLWRLKVVSARHTYLSYNTQDTSSDLKSVTLNEATQPKNNSNDLSLDESNYDCLNIDTFSNEKVAGNEWLVGKGKTSCSIQPGDPAGSGDHYHVYSIDLNNGLYAIWMSVTETEAMNNVFKLAIETFSQTTRTSPNTFENEVMQVTTPAGWTIQDKGSSIVLLKNQFKLNIHSLEYNDELPSISRYLTRLNEIDLSRCNFQITSDTEQVTDKIERVEVTVNNLSDESLQKCTYPNAAPGISREAVPEDLWYGTIFFSDAENYLFQPKANISGNKSIYAITLTLGDTYEESFIGGLPAKNNPTLNQMIDEASEIIATIKFT